MRFLKIFRVVKLNRAKNYCKNDKERLIEQTRGKYRSLSEEKKTKRENMEKTDIIWKKQRLKEY